MHRWSRPTRLADCLLHGPDSGAELFVVEGSSAAAAVLAVRDPLRQAVLPLQGMPLAGHRAPPARVAADPFLRAFAQALGLEPGERCTLGPLRYERVLLLTDPDADGIHIGALLLLHVHRWLRPLLDGARLERMIAPIGEVHANAQDAPWPAFGDAHLRALHERARAGGVPLAIARRYRGLASIGATMLRATCVDPSTRLTAVLGEPDAQAALAVFGGPAAQREATQAATPVIATAEPRFSQRSARGLANSRRARAASAIHAPSTTASTASVTATSSAQPSQPTRGRSTIVGNSAT
jgi:DNA gyrase subunit B/topoisomerase-4 subunit B